MRTIGLMLAIGGLCAACGGSGASVAFDVAVEALDSAPAAGVAASFQVRVLNDDRSVATGFTGTVALTSSDPAAVFDSVLAFTAASGGVAVLDVVFRTAGPQTLVVDAGGDPASVAVNVVPAAATSFLVDVSDDQPSGKNRPMNGVATATALDAFGNVVTDFSALTDPVTLRVESGNVAVAGLGGVNADTLSSTDDFVEGTATLHGRVVLQGVASAARLVLESATGATGRSGAFSIDTMGPVPAAAALLLDVNRTGAIDQGDQLTLAFDEDLVVDGATPNDIALNDPGDDLGLGATVELGPAAHQLKITLGAGATLRPEGLASGIAVRATNAIASAATGAPVESGAPADVVPFPVQGPTFTTAGELRGVARGDFDGDGDLDLAVAAYHRDGRVLLNDGAAGFTEHMRVAVSSAQGRVASGDLDGDGDVDLVFASGNRGRIFVNDGAGTFTFARHTPLPVGIPVGNL
ncbi:MAG: FG-GAP-like repeat-containing protein, partial [Planctomycetota bacterium]|nr:FG-GAP-like repeat-containing protein [Planctomycetota bacterium]